MKAKQINGQIMFGLPKFYTTATTSYVGDFHKQSDEVHEAEGFFEVVYPELTNPRLQGYGELFFDEIRKVFTCQIIDIEINLNDLKQQHREAVFEAIREISQIASDVKNVYDPLRTNPENIPEDFKLLVGQVLPLRERAYDEIEALATVDEALNYIVRGPEVEGYILQLKSFL